MKERSRSLRKSSSNSKHDESSSALLKGRMKTTPLPPLVILLAGEGREDITGDMKEGGMISGVISLSLKDN